MKAGGARERPKIPREADKTWPLCCEVRPLSIHHFCAQIRRAAMFELKVRTAEIRDAASPHLVVNSLHVHPGKQLAIGDSGF